jgi:hypothetical protein
MTAFHLTVSELPRPALRRDIARRDVRVRCKPGFLLPVRVLSRL